MPKVPSDPNHSIHHFLFYRRKSAVNSDVASVSCVVMAVGNVGLRLEVIVRKTLRASGAMWRRVAVWLLKDTLLPSVFRLLVMTCIVSGGALDCAHSLTYLYYLAFRQC